MKLRFLGKKSSKDGQFAMWGIGNKQWRIQGFNRKGCANPKGVREEVFLWTIFHQILHVNKSFLAKSQVISKMERCTVMCYGNRRFEQECIPVGCVLPTCWPYPIISNVSRGSAQPRWMQNCKWLNLLCPWRQRPSWMQTPPPLEADPLVNWPVMHAGKPPPWTEWQIDVKTLVTTVNSTTILRGISNSCRFSKIDTMP